MVIWIFVDCPGYNTRINEWILALKIWWKFWALHGCGIGNWKVEFIYLYKIGIFKTGFIRLHNTFIQGLVELGPAFFIALGGYAFHILRNCKSLNIPTSAIVAIFIMANINTVERMNAINLMVIILWLAIFEIQRKENHEKVEI